MRDTYQLAALPTDQLGPPPEAAGLVDVPEPAVVYGDERYYPLLERLPVVGVYVGGVAARRVKVQRVATRPTTIRDVFVRR